MRALFTALLLSTVALCGVAQLAQAASQTVPSIALDTSIDPSSEEWLDHSLKDAAKQDAPLVIVRLDTPGGLDSSMREMVKDIIAAPMPVVVYVSPDGARAASAGLFVTEAADVAAMAPQTNIGSASPINIGPGPDNKVLGRKIKNDAAAYVRALASEHGRNPDLAEEMVRKATNVQASVALQKGLIDVVASSQDELLQKLDGFKVKGTKAKKLKTGGLRVVERERTFKYKALELLVDPNIAFLLLLIGFAGIGFEIFNPGLIAPGAFGGVSLILALFGIAQLPVTVAGVLLILLAVVLLIAEAHLPTHGILGVAGTVSLVAGGLLLFNDDSGDYGVSVPLVVVIALLFAGGLLLIVSKAVQARHGHVQTGWEELIGESARVRIELNPDGQVFTHGALWQAHASDGETIEIGATVVVERVEGLTLYVRRAKDDTDVVPR